MAINLEHWMQHDVMVETRTILLADHTDDGVDDQMANRFIKALRYLEYQSRDPVTVILKTQGGCIWNGAAIYDSILLSKCHITAEVYGPCMSMGAIILQAADERHMSPNSMLMMHDGTFSSDDSTRTFENWAIIAKKLRQDMYKIFAGRAGRTAKYWERKCQADYILTPEEALKEGLIDLVLGSS